MFLKEKLVGFNELAGIVKEYSLKLLTDKYNSGSCNLGNNGGEILSERESLFMVITSDFDDERIKLIQCGTDEVFPYKIVVETNGDLISTYEIGLMLDELEEYLPTKMIDDLDDEFYKFTLDITEN